MQAPCSDDPQLSPTVSQSDNGNSVTSSASSSLMSAMEAKDKIIDSLQAQLLKAEQELSAYNAKYCKLKNMQESVDGEIHELTASLFQEAYRIANEAHEKRVAAEKLLVEANGKVAMLQAEVKALKMCSYPTSCVGSFKFPRSYNPVKLFRKLSLSEGKRHRRNNSDCVSGRSVSRNGGDEDGASFKDLVELDPICHQEFVSWRETLNLGNVEHPFMKRIFAEDVEPCLTFSNRELSAKLSSSILDNTILLEKIRPEQSKICCLSQVPRECSYRMKTCNADDWHLVSSFCRNRIAAVCDLFTYFRYLSQGLLHRGIYESYVEMVQLRRNIALARLGIKCVSEKSN